MSAEHSRVDVKDSSDQGGGGEVSASPRSGSSRPKPQSRRSPLATYFLTVLLTFGVVSIALNSLLAQSHLHHDQGGTISAVLQESLAHLGSDGSSNNNNNSNKPQQVTTDGESEKTTTEQQQFSLAGLDCTRYGGPVETHDFVYWQDIPEDNRHVSPFHRKRKGHISKDEYLTFEPDHGGWNNIRMAMETILALAFAMGRTLVLPPEKQLYLLSEKKHAQHGVEQKTEFSFADFFHMDSIHQEHEGLDIITMDEFLKREGMTGNFVSAKNNKVVFPPGLQTDFKGKPEAVFRWLREHALNVVWKPDDCLAVFPADESQAAEDDTKATFKQMLKDNPQFEDFVGKPVPVDAPTLDRLKESRAGRSEMCLYNHEMQSAPVLHFPVDHDMKARLLVNPYQFLFFQDYKEDLWLKRFIRDHIRYADEIQCAAARVTLAVRKKAREYSPTNTEGNFDSIHVRRGDFQVRICIPFSVLGWH